MKKQKLSLEDLEKLKESGILNDNNSQDIEIDGSDILGGKNDTVDTHWPTTSTNAEPGND